jgi:hypothetical protein
VMISNRHQGLSVLGKLRGQSNIRACNRTLKSLRASLSKYALATIVLKLTDNVQFMRPKNQTYFFIFTVWLKLPGTYAADHKTQSHSCHIDPPPAVKVHCKLCMCTQECMVHIFQFHRQMFCNWKFEKNISSLAFMSAEFLQLRVLDKTFKDAYFKARNSPPY